jgi:hypothetical protein
MRAAVINCSSDYNLGTEKLAHWLRASGYEVIKAKPGFSSWEGVDKAFFGALYTWDIPELVRAASGASKFSEIEIGGPAAALMAAYIRAHLGIDPTLGLDPRFDQMPGRYRATYTSRGCTLRCPWCSVPLVEGALRELPDFVPAPSVLDNNFLACSRAHVTKTVERLASQPYVDFLHGLDARLLEPWHVELLLSRLRMPCWRFTFDSLKHESRLRGIIDMLADYGVRADESVVVYCLYGYDDTPVDAYRRRDVVLSLGAHPYAMRHQPLDALSKDGFAPEGWSPRELREFWNLCNIPTSAWILKAMARVAKS